MAIEGRFRHKSGTFDINKATGVNYKTVVFMEFYVRKLMKYMRKAKSGSGLLVCGPGLAITRRVRRRPVLCRRGMVVDGRMSKSVWIIADRPCVGKAASGVAGHGTIAFVSPAQARTIACRRNS